MNTIKIQIDPVRNNLTKKVINKMVAEIQKQDANDFVMFAKWAPTKSKLTKWKNLQVDTKCRVFPVGYLDKVYNLATEYSKVC